MALTTKRIIALPSQTDPQEGDYLAIDNATNGTHKIPVGRIGVEVDGTLTEAGKAADAKATGDALGEIRSQVEATDDAIDEIRSQIEVTGTASGAIATFTDGADAPMKSCMVTIVPKQAGSGTPSPDNVRPISGWESVNVNVASDNLCSDLEQGYWAFSGGTDGSDNQAWVRTPKVECEPNTSYTAKADERYTRYQGFVYWDADGTFISSRSSERDALIDYTETTPANARYMAFNIAEERYGTHIQPSDVSRFGIYKTDELNTTTTDLGQTVYGATLDVVSGALTADRAFVTFDGSSDETFYTGSSGMPFRVILSDANKPSSASALAGIVSNQMTEVTQDSTWGTVGTCALIANTNQLYFKLADDLTDISELRTYLASNPLQIVYPLATPQTYQLTPTEVNTLLGENNVWADSGDVEVVYVRDLNIAINNLLNSNGTRALGMMAMSAPTEATAEEPTDEQTEEPAEADMR